MYSATYQNYIGTFINNAMKQFVADIRNNLSVFLPSRSYSNRLLLGIEYSVVQPIRHLPHVANGHLNVANSFVLEHFKNRMFWGKIR